MDGVEVIDLCCVSQMKNDDLCKGKESAKQESQDKMKTNIIARKNKNRPGTGKPTAKNKETKTAMMCWENLKDPLAKEPHVESEDEGENPSKKHKNQNMKITCQTYSQYKQLTKNLDRSIFWKTEDDGSTLDTQETEQLQLVYITNLEGGLQMDGTNLYEEEGLNDKKPAVKNKHFEKPTLNKILITLMNCTKNLVVITRTSKNLPRERIITT